MNSKIYLAIFLAALLVMPWVHGYGQGQLQNKKTFHAVPVFDCTEKNHPPNTPGVPTKFKCYMDLKSMPTKNRVFGEVPARTAHDLLWQFDDWNGYLQIGLDGIVRWAQMGEWSLSLVMPNQDPFNDSFAAKVTQRYLRPDRIAIYTDKKRKWNDPPAYEITVPLHGVDCDGNGREDQLSLSNLGLGGESGQLLSYLEACNAGDVKNLLSSTLVVFDLKERKEIFRASNVLNYRWIKKGELYFSNLPEYGNVRIPATSKALISRYILSENHMEQLGAWNLESGLAAVTFVDRLNREPSELIALALGKNAKILKIRSGGIEEQTFPELKKVLAPEFWPDEFIFDEETQKIFIGGPWWNQYVSEIDLKANSYYLFPGAGEDWYGQKMLGRQFFYERGSKGDKIGLSKITRLSNRTSFVFDPKAYAPPGYHFQSNHGVYENFIYVIFCPNPPQNRDGECIYRLFQVTDE